MRDLNDLRLFVMVVEAGGYAAASRKHAIARATLSRRIAALEDDLGLRLIERSSRSFRLTQPGRLLFERGQQVVADAATAFAAIDETSAAPKGLVRIAVAPSVLQLKLDTMLGDYLGRNPKVQLQIEATNRRIDLAREGFDFVIRASASPRAGQDHVILPLAQIDHQLVIAPLWRDHLRDSLADSLRAIPSLAFAATGQPAAWRLQGRGAGLHRVDLEPRLCVEDMQMLRQAAVAGLGMALLPRILAAEDLAQGRLLPVDLDLRAPRGRIHAVHLGKKGMRPVVRHLLDHLAVGYGQLCAGSAIGTGIGAGTAKGA